MCFIDYQQLFFEEVIYEIMHLVKKNSNSRINFRRLNLICFLTFQGSHETAEAENFALVACYAT